MLQSQTPIGYYDPYFSGLYAAYGHHVFPQMMEIAPVRVPLPLDLAEDGPIYVNAKQYHGILRQRQIRAKLETQNKLAKSRKSQTPIGYYDPYFSGLYAAYGHHVFPQMMEIAPVRVPLPLDLAEDGPIYVNAKQYHGILRQRQIRAKLETQNKLAKSRKPYLHESRYLHAVNRVRGSGGCFLSSKRRPC